jgi:hypothetical protein
VTRADLRRPLAFSVLVVMACARPPPRTRLDDEPPRLVNAFFGLDDALPARAAGLCLAAPGKDGMPVTFSRRVAGPLAPVAFTVVTRSGARKTAVCATTSPASARSKRHTVLLIGDLGSEADPPMTVSVTGELLLEGGVNAKGLSAPVTPLADGPTLVLALQATPATLESTCPSSTRQIVTVVWAGGVTPVSGASADAHRDAYRVRTAEGDVTPFALGDLGDSDNYEHLCLDVASPALSVSCRAGVLVDPRGDANPDTSVEVSAAR